MSTRLAALVAAFCIFATASFTPSQDAQRIYPGEIYRPMWNYVKDCSGFPVQPGGDYEDVKWFTFPPNARGKDIIGEWVTPDTIYLDEGLAGVLPWLVAHELLHHLIQDTKGDPHPWIPFTFPCKLMPFQNLPGT